MAPQNEIKISPHFWLRRMHSLSGVFPIGAFLIQHMLSNSMILLGPEAYDGLIHTLSGLPYVIWIEIFFIYLPILFHAFYGFYIAFTGKSNLSSYPYPGNWMYMLQRWSGAVTFVYVMTHAYHTRIVNLLYGTEISFARMQELVSDPRMFAFYIVGLAAVMFHFGNGLWGFLISWGIVVGKRAQAVSSVICGLLGLVLFVMGMNSLLYLVR